MTPSQRIEAAARADAAFDGRDFDRLGRADKQRYLTRSAGSLAAGYPELNGGSPTHWVAPNEATPEMVEAEEATRWHGEDGHLERYEFAEEYAYARSAYLNTQGQG